MRDATFVEQFLCVKGLRVVGLEFVPQGLVIDVEPEAKTSSCGVCGRMSPRYDRRPKRLWRHLAFGRTVTWLRYDVWRVDCPTCGVRTEAVPWARHSSRFTRALEELAAAFAQATDLSKTAELLAIAWRSVLHVVQRVVQDRLDPRRFDGLRRIGIDEFSYRRRRKYLTLVVDHDRGRVIWAKKGGTADTLRAFFEEVGGERLATVQSVTVDMATAWIQPLREYVPQATVIFDRFHVQALASEALDEVRRKLRHTLKDKEEGRALYHSRFALLRRPWNLSQDEKERLSKIQRSNAPLYRAYLLKEALARALEYRSPHRAKKALEKWLSWARRSRLRQFVTMARTVKKFFAGILAYVEERLTNGRLEGINNRLRMIARRAFGFHSPKTLIAMLFLCCGGIRLDPPIPRPT